MVDVVADTAKCLRLTHPDLFNIAVAINKVVGKKYPELSQLLPFKNGWRMKVYSDGNWIIASMIDNPGGSKNHISEFKESEVQSVLEKLIPYKSLNPTYSIKNKNWHTVAGPDWFSDDCFTYIRSIQSPPDMDTLWGDIAEQLSFYLDFFLLPRLEIKQRIIVRKFLPEPPASYNLSEITPSLWVLECEEKCYQGTAFMLENVGLVSCFHVLGSATKAFMPSSPNKKYPVEVIAKNETIDLAILNIELDKAPFLRKGTAEKVEQQDSIAVVGFPNYRLGDSGIINTGQVAGFRPVSAIRRLLVNTPIVTGCSGGPVLDSKGLVIGVAVTGADCMENVPDTENHGVIPIDALAFLI